MPHDEEEIVVPNILDMPHGVRPIVIPLTSKQDEVTRVLNEIRKLQQHGIPWQDILVIHASREEAAHITCG